MKKKIVLLSIFILILLSGCFFQLPEKVTVKSAPTYNFNVGSFSKSFSEQFDVKSLFTSLEEKDPRIKIYDYNPEGTSEYQQFLLKMPIQDIQLDFGDFINEIGLSDAVKDISFNKTIKIPEISFSKNESFDISGLKDVVGNFISVASHTTSENPSSIPFVGEGKFTQISYTSGNLIISITNGTSNSVKLIKDGITKYIFDGDGNTFTLDLSGKTIYSDMQIQFDSGSAITYTMYAENTVVSKASGINNIQNFSKEIDLDLGFDSLGVKSCTIADGSVSAKTNVPSGWEGVTIAKSIELTGAIEENFNDELNLQDVSLEDDEIGMNAIATLTLNNATIDFSKNLDLDVQFKVNSFSEVSMELDTNQDSLSISESYDLPKEMSKYIKTISLSKSQITGTYTNTLPAENDISISATSNFLGLDDTETLAANNKSKEIKIGNDSNVEKTITISDNSKIDFKVNVMLPGATKENPNLICVKNVTPGTTYELGMNLSFDLDWTKVCLNEITTESQKGAFATDFSLKSVFSSIDDSFKTNFASKIQINALPLYLYVEKPELTLFNNFTFSNESKIEIGNGTVTDNNANFSSETKEINQLVFCEFPKLDFADSTIVTTDISKKNYSSFIDLKDVINGQINEGDSLCIEYNIGFTMDDYSEDIEITKTELEEAGENTSISIYLVVVVPLDFDLTEEESINLLDVVDLQLSGDKDLFNRDSATENEQLSEVLKQIRSTSLNYEVIKTPFYSSNGMSFEVEFTQDNKFTLGIENGSINIDPQELLSSYPLQPKVLLNIPKTNFYFSRDDSFEVALSIKIDADAEIEIFGGEK